MAAGDPTGEDLCVGTTNGNALPVYSTFEEREITFGTPIELTSGVIYAIIVRSGVNQSNAALWQDKIPGGAYADGSLFTSIDSGISWTAGLSADCWFKTYSSGDLKDSYTHTTLGGAWAYAGIWSAQTFLATSTYTITSVILPLCKYLVGSIPGTITVSIRATEAAPTKATTPAPANAVTNVTLDQATLGWVDGGGADTYDVYYGTESGSLTKVSSGQVGTSLTITGIDDGSPFSHIVTRYWRIDSINDAGTTTGDEWSFTTITFYPPGPVYWYATGSYYYQLLVDADGDYGSPPPGGVENADYAVVSDPNPIRTAKRLVAVANNKFWYEAT